MPRGCPACGIELLAGHDCRLLWRLTSYPSVLLFSFGSAESRSLGVGVGLPVDRDLRKFNLYSICFDTYVIDT